MRWSGVEWRGGEMGGGKVLFCGFDFDFLGGGKGGEGEEGRGGKRGNVTNRQHVA